MDTPFEFDAPTGLMLAVDLYELGSDTPIATDIPVTEEANRKMTYRGIISAAASGWHKIYIKDGVSGSWIGIKESARLVDTGDLQFFSDDVDLTSLPDVNESEAIFVNVLQNENMVAGVSVAEALRRIGGITSGVLSDAGSGVETVYDWENSVKTMVCTIDQATGSRLSWVFN